jgi:ElaB/YqjD/DUF883 family membrane-anchored ribosome-binding protein
MSESNSTSGRSSEEIRAEIDRTRADMHNTVDQLEARLSPGQLLDELWGRMRQGGGGSATDLVRDHPVPLALMGLGVAMLAVEHSKGKHAYGHEGHGYIGSTDRAEGRKGPYRGEDVDHVKFNDRATGIGSVSDMGSSDGDGSGLKDKASDLLHGAKDAVSSVGDRLGGAADGLRERASHLADSAGERLGGAREHVSELRGETGETARRAMGGIDRVIHDQPLIAGAITFGLGLAAGLAVPTTRFEDEKLGATSDQLKDAAKEKASEAGEKALEVIGQAAGSVKEAASEIKDTINDPELKDALAAKAREVVDVAKTAASETVDLAAGSVSRGSDSDMTAGSSARGSDSTMS